MTNMNSNFYCVIMAGGTGTRFWPMSKASRPKQFLEIAETGKSFLRSTYERYTGIVPAENILVVTTDRLGCLVREQLPELREENLLLEPYGRDTAPCIAYATYTLLKRDPEATMVVTPADHIIWDNDAFKEDLMAALEYSSGKDVLMTLGIQPVRPDPNYGYIQVSGGRCSTDRHEAVKVKTFTEKPDVELAKVFISSGEFLWNSGIFVWRADSIRAEMERYIPEVTRLFRGWENAIGSPVEDMFIEKVYSDCIKISIDYGVMEKTAKAWLYPAHFRWADVGTWESLYNIVHDKDDFGNVFNSRNILSKDNIESLIISEDTDKLMAVTGLKDFVVIDTRDALLICPKSDKRVKDLAEFDLDSLRWNKIVICTDADVDGFQIRTLILTMLYRLVPTLIREGYVYIAESPLFEISTKDKTWFAYSDAEKNTIVKKLEGKKYTVNRSKGLGENEPEMMWMTTMNPATRRLIKVMPEDAEKTAQVFDLLLGDNLPGRKDHIAENGYKYLELADIS